MFKPLLHSELYVCTPVCQKACSMEVLAIHALLIFQPITVHSELALEYSSLLRTSIGVPAESQIQELF